MHQQVMIKRVGVGALTIFQTVGFGKPLELVR
jgi:hypothetical protein